MIRKIEVTYFWYQFCSFPAWNNHFVVSILNLIFYQNTNYDYKFVMGASNNRQLLTPEMDDFYSRFTFLRSKGSVSYYIENSTSREYATKSIQVDTPEEESQFFANIQKALEFKHQNIISVQKIYSLENKSCGTTSGKFMIVFPYSFRNIKDQRAERIVLQEGFTQPEIWSIILSICRSFLFLQQRGIPFNPITPQQILIDKEGVIQIDANRLVDDNNIQDNYVSRMKNLRYLPPEFRYSKVNYLNPRQIQKCNIYSIGIIAMECLEMRDITEIQQVSEPQQKEIIQLLINRCTFVSQELRQTIRRLTQSIQNRPTYRDIIDFIQDEENATSFLYYQNEVRTAKKNSLVVNNNFLNFDGFGARPSSNMVPNMQRSSTVPNGGYSIPSFSYNNITKQIKGNQTIQNTSPSEVRVVYEDGAQIQNVNPLNFPNPIELFPSYQIPQNKNVPMISPLSLNNHQSPKLNSNTNQQLAMRQISMKTSNASNMIINSVRPQEVKANNISILESPYVIKHAESNITPVQSYFKLKDAGVAENVRMITPKPSFLARDSSFTNPREVFKKQCFSKTGSMQGFNKIYNDNPVKLYQKIDYRNLNNIEGTWLYFEGNFRDGLRFGPGTLYLSNGEIFQGNFINDTPEGKGKYSTLDWKSIEGIWREGQLISIL